MAQMLSIFILVIGQFTISVEPGYHSPEWAFGQTPKADTTIVADDVFELLFSMMDREFYVDEKHKSFLTKKPIDNRHYPDKVDTIMVLKTENEYARIYKNYLYFSSIMEYQGRPESILFKSSDKKILADTYAFFQDKFQLNIEHHHNVLIKSTYDMDEFLLGIEKGRLIYLAYKNPNFE